MSERNTIVRGMHDLGLAAWFGGSLAGAVAVNGAAADVPDPELRLRVANAGWARWAPVNLAAVGVHLIGATGILLANQGRARKQGGVGANTVVKLMLTGAALGVSGYSGVLGARLRKEEGTPVEGGTDPSAQTPSQVAGILRQLDVCQWLIPALTGAAVVSTSLHGEQQRPGQQLSGVLGTIVRRLNRAA
jgi:hypothetical protein